MNGAMLTNKDSKALDARGGVRDGTDFIVYPKHGRSNQQWFLVEVTDEEVKAFAEVADPNQG